MEKLREFATITYPSKNSLQPFSLRGSTNDQFCLITPKSAQFLNLCFRYNENVTPNFIKTAYDIPQTMPTDKINVCHKTVWKRANVIQKQELTVDVVLMPRQFKIHIIDFISIRWSPASVTIRNEAYIACLTNYGGCTICYRVDDERNWLEVADISNIWLNYCTPRPNNRKILQFDRLKEMAHDVHITAIEWNNICINNQCGFAIVSASGKLVLFGVGKQSTVTPETVHVEQKIVYETKLFKVNILKWFSYYDCNQRLKSVLLVGDLNGTLRMYNVVINEVTGHIKKIVKSTILWNDNDRQKFTELICEFNYGNERLTIVSCKEQYVHVFVMNSKGIFPTMSHKVPDSVITGLYRLTPNRYIVCTMGGTIQDLTIEKDLNITAQEIECGVHFDKYSLNGILISNNQAYWALALYSRQPSDQFVLRQPTIISFCATSAAGLLGKLLSNESLCLTNYYDCAEMMRLIELTRGDLPDEYYQGNANPNETIDNYLYQLKIRLILCYARRVYFERQGRQVESDYLCYEFKYIQKMILAITYYKRLKHLISIENFNEMLPFQQLAGKTWRAHLYAYLEEETVLQDYIDARNTLKINFDILLAETAGFDTFPSEFCLHCDKEIEVNTLECPDQHEIPRCCVTLLQVPLGNRRVCRQCHAVALGDISILQEATMMKLEQFYCPRCDVPLEQNSGVLVENNQP